MDPLAAAPSLRSIHVVAGVIRDARGRVLLARRTEGRDLAGLWEFPGGKREPGESAEAALARELHEELGIEVEVGEPLIDVPQRYADKRLNLDVRMIRRWQGRARGREGQALAWVPPERLHCYAMPPADRPVVAALLQPALCLVTPEPEDDAGWLRGLELALESGIRRVQLRAMTLEPLRWRALAAAAVDRCRAAGADAYLNGDAALARELGTGLHLRSAQLTAFERGPGPDGMPLSASCHDLPGVQAAQALGCDFALVGTIKPSASHPGRPGIGWDAFAGLREHASLPLYGIGGLGPDDVAEARRHGAQGIAAIRALWPTD